MIYTDEETAYRNAVMSTVYNETIEMTLEKLVKWRKLLNTCETWKSMYQFLDVFIDKNSEKHYSTSYTVSEFELNKDATTEPPSIRDDDFNDDEYLDDEFLTRVRHC